MTYRRHLGPSMGFWAGPRREEAWAPAQLRWLAGCLGTHLRTGEGHPTRGVGSLRRVRCSSAAGSFSAALKTGLTPGARARVRSLWGSPDELKN